MRFPIPQNEVKQASITLYLPDGKLYNPIRDSSARIEEERQKQERIVTGLPPIRDNEVGTSVEIVRDPENTGRLMFLRWEDGRASVCDSIECGGRIFVPPDPTSNAFPHLSLPSGLAPCGEPAELVADIVETFSGFIECDRKQLLVAASFALTTWFPECFEAAPYVWLVGPFGSAKTKFLRLLWCFCRRGLLAGDIRSASIYQVVNGVASHANHRRVGARPVRHEC